MKMSYAKLIYMWKHPKVGKELLLISYKVNCTSLLCIRGNTLYTHYTVILNSWAIINKSIVSFILKPFTRVPNTRYLALLEIKRVYGSWLHRHKLHLAEDEEFLEMALAQSPQCPRRSDLAFYTDNGSAPSSHFTFTEVRTVSGPNVSRRLTTQLWVKPPRYSALY